MYKSPTDDSNKVSDVPSKKQVKRSKSVISQQSSPTEVTENTEKNEVRVSPCSQVVAKNDNRGHKADKKDTGHNREGRRGNGAYSE